MMVFSISLRKVNSIDLNIPPAQDSPKHILNALNDFCIQSIFQYLTNVPDFVNTSAVCTRFLDNAKACFQLTHKTIDIFDSSDNHPCRNNRWRIQNHLLSSKQQQTLLQDFGHLIYGIRYGACHSMENPDHDVNLFKSLIQYCGPTLSQLKVYRHLCDTEKIGSSHAVISFDHPSQFPALKELQLDEISVDKFQLSSSLEKLTLYGVKSMHFDDCVRAYPKLLKFAIEFDGRAEIPNQMESNLLRILELNPKIIHLIVPAIAVNLKDIHHRTPDLETFCCMRFEGGLNHPEKFHKLKHFTVGEITDEQLILLATNMPCLESVKIYICKELHAKGIAKTLELAKSVNELFLFDMNIDSDDYHSILRSIKARSKPCFVRVRCIDDVPANIFCANSKCLYSVWCRYTN